MNINISCLIGDYVLLDNRWIPDANYFDVTKIKCPIQGHFGQSDDLKGFSDPEVS